MVVIDFWIQKHLLPVIGENSLEKSNSIKLACWFSIESNGITQSGENLLQSMAMLNSKTLFGGEWDRWYFETLWQRIYQVICSNPCGVKIFVLNSRIGGSGHENKNQAINIWLAWQLLLLIINPDIICPKKKWMKEYFAFIQEKPMFIKKCCWHRVIGSKAKCNNPLTWWGLWCGLSIGL